MPPPNPTIQGMAPCQLNATVLAIQDLAYTPNLVVEPFRSSGYLFGQIARVAGATPAIRFRTPFLGAYNLIGLKFLRITTLNLALATFTSGAKTANGTVWSLASDAIGSAIITGASVAQNGLLMADILVLLASGDGIAPPLSSATAAVPTLAGLPTLHTAGPVVANGTTLWGCTGWSVDLGNDLVPVITDGRTYPTAHAHRTGEVRARLEHEDVATLWGTLGDLGLVASGAGFVLYGRAISNGVITTTGVSLTIASGRANLSEWSVAVNEPPRPGVQIDALSADDTHPIVVATGATIPTT